MTEPLIADFDAALAAVREHGWKLQYCSEELRDNADLVLAAVRQNGDALRYAGETARNNIFVARAAVKQTGLAYRHLGAQLLSETHNVLDLAGSAVGQNGMALQYVKKPQNMSPTDQDRYAIWVVERALRENGLALQFAGKDVQDNFWKVQKAVRQNGEALQYASPRLQADIGIVGDALFHTHVPVQVESYARLTPADLAKAYEQAAQWKKSKPGWKLDGIHYHGGLAVDTSIKSEVTGR